MRHLGIVLIALPELVTTPLGVALILTSNYLSRRLEANVLKRLRAKLKHYLAHFRHFGDERKSDATEIITHHALNETPLVPRQHTGNHSIEENPRPAMLQSRHDSGEKIVPHTVDIKRLSQRYPSGDSAKIEPNLADTPGSAAPVVHHAINLKALSRRFKDDDSVEADTNSTRTIVAMQGVVHHAVNLNSLAKRYTVDDTTDASLHLPAMSGTAERTMQHKVNEKLLSQRYEAGVAIPVKVNHHAINRTSLIRRYGPAASPTPASKAH